MNYKILGGLVAAFIAWITLTQDASAASTLSRSEAKNLFSSDVNRWLSEARQAAAKHGIDPRVMLAIADQESNGKDLEFHPDSVSYGLVGLTKGGALADLGIDRELTSLSPSEQFDIAAEFLALLKKREGSLYEALKWYNSGKHGGGHYARTILKKAAMQGKIPQGAAKAEATSKTPAAQTQGGDATAGNVPVDGGENVTAPPAPTDSIDLGEFALPEQDYTTRDPEEEQNETSGSTTGDTWSVTGGTGIEKDGTLTVI